ncbi:DinB family protein [bacterium]|nr:MAG: DinB family protein [bacterium]
MAPMQLGYLLKGLELAPATVQRILDRVPDSAFDEKRDPERFTLREAIAHLTDWEPINIDRLRRGVEEPGCTVPGYDEGQRAIDLDYASLDPREQTRLYAERRGESVAYLRTLTEEDWTKVYTHSERGLQTVYEQAVTILGHDMYHVEQFTEYL